MATRNQIKERSIEKVRRERASIPWQYCLMGLGCALIMAAGFFLAAKQHFSSVELSMKNSELRKTKQSLMDEQRKLGFVRDQVTSVANIEKAGMKIGLKKFTPDDFQFIETAKNLAQPDTTKTMTDAKGKTLTEKTDAPKITKTVSIKPVDTARKDTGVRSGKTETKETGRTLIAKK